MKRRRKLSEMGGAYAFIFATALSLCSFFAVSLICALASSFFENSRAGAEYLTLVALLVSGLIAGFISRKMLHTLPKSLLPSGLVCIAFAIIATVTGGYSLGAFMNELSFFLLSLVGIFLGRERSARRRHR